MPDPKNKPSWAVDDTPSAPSWAVDAANAVGRDAIQGQTPQGREERAEDLLNMLPAGATFGFDDELSGAAHVAGKALGLTNQGYREAQQAREASKAASVERSPGAAFAGNVLGGTGIGMAASAVGGPLAVLGGTARAAEGAGPLARAGTAVANLAVPGALQGAGDAPTLADVPAGAAQGAAFTTGVGAAMHAPGALSERLASPRLQQWAARNEAKAGLRTMGHEGKALTNIETQQPGGQVGYYRRLRERGIGTGFWPTPTKTAEQAAEQAEILDAQRRALADRGANVRLTAEGNEAAIRARAGQEYPTVADRDLRARMNEEAAAQGQAGTPTYAVPEQYPSTNETALARYSHTSPVINTQATREVSLPEQAAEISAYNRRAYDAAGAKDSASADMYRATAQTMNDQAEEALNKVEPGLGTEWRGVRRSEADVIRARDTATVASAKAPVLRGMYRGGARGMAVAGGASGNGVMALAGLAGEIASSPVLQAHGYRGVGAVSRAAGRANTALGRIMSRLPGGRMAVARAFSPEVDEGSEEVQRAALEGGPGAAAAQNYLTSETNPMYNQAVNRPHE